MATAFLGPRGTFSEEAALAHAGPDGDLVAFASFPALTSAVETGLAREALLPIENSIEGAVSATLDLLIHETPLRICAEVDLPVRHFLVTVPGAELGDIRVVASHPQALGQCRRFLDAALPGVEQVAATSTAEAVRAVVGDPEGGRAAIGPRLAAERYGAEVLREGVEDETGNVTRFVWLAPGGTAPAETGGTWRTSLAFAGRGADAPGWLVRCLSEFAFRGVNLTRIESRPSREGLGRYRFFVDLDGAAGAQEVAEAVAGLRVHCEEVRVLGTYPAA